MQFTVDMDLCESHGQCVFAAPEVFSFDDEDHLVVAPVPDPDESLSDKIEKAASACPVRAITLAPAAR
ncbi:ferredoxin [Streptomyces sp. NPDC004051]